LLVAVTVTTDFIITTCRCLLFFFFNDTATTEIYTLSLHDALPISRMGGVGLHVKDLGRSVDFLSTVLGLEVSERSGNRAYLTSKDRKSTRLNSSHVAISYAVFCLKKKNGLRI